MIMSVIERNVTICQNMRRKLSIVFDRRRCPFRSKIGNAHRYGKPVREAITKIKIGPLNADCSKIVLIHPGCWIIYIVFPMAEKFLVIEIIYVIDTKPARMPGGNPGLCESECGE